MNVIEIPVGVQGFYKLTKHKADANGEPILGTAEEIDWFPNIITDVGINGLAGAGDAMFHISCVGTGNTVPAASDTNLVSQVGTRAFNNGAGESSVKINNNVVPYYGALRRTWRYAVGTATGVLAEVGVKSSAGILFSRALIVDGLGAPTTLTVLSDEILDVTYECRVYPPTSDVVSVVSVDGVSTTVTLRTASAGGAGGISHITNPWVPTPGTPFLENSNVTVYGADAVLGGINAVPTATSILVYSSAVGGNRMPTGSQPAYINNSYYRDQKCFLGLTDANVAGGVGAMVMSRNEAFAYQMGFSPVIAKTNTKVLNVAVRTAYARAP